MLFLCHPNNGTSANIQFFFTDYRRLTTIFANVNLQVVFAEVQRAATRLPQRGLTALGLVFHWDSVPRVLNPPTPFQGSDQAFVRTKAQGYRFAVLRPASDDALIKTLRAAYASSTYLLPLIHGPGRSSDDDLLIPLRLSEKSSRD